MTPAEAGFNAVLERERRENRSFATADLLGSRLQLKSCTRAARTGSSHSGLSFSARNEIQLAAIAHRLLLNPSIRLYYIGRRVHCDAFSENIRTVMSCS
jgi:hypothetical protein